MPVTSDLQIVIEQEKQLVFQNFDEETAFGLGVGLRSRALSEGLAIVVDVRTWGRPLFYCALAGTSGENQHWIRRKSNVVQRFSKSTYRMVLEKTHEGMLFPPHRALDPAEFILAGGGFPIRVKGAGIIGSMTVSGLSERNDHILVVETMADALKIARTAIALPNQ